MARFPIKSRLVLGKVEATPGVDAAPVPASDAIRVDNPQFSPTGEVDNGEDTVTNSVDAGAPVVLGAGISAQFAVRAKGSNAGGTAPEYGPLLRGCALAEELIAADVSDVLRAGSTASVFNLATGDGAGARVGQVIELTSGAQSGYRGVIVSIATDDVTVTPAAGGAPATSDDYTLRACAIYTPISIDQETVSLYQYENPANSADNSRLTKLIGGMGNVALELNTRGTNRFNFNFSGILPSDPAGVTTPTGEVYDAGAAPAFVSADVYLDDVAIKLQSANIDLRNAVGHPPDPDSADGLDYGHVGGRRIGGTINVVKNALSVRNAMAEFRAGTERKFWTRFGSAAGQSISLFIPQMRYDGPPGESEIAQSGGEQLPIRALGSDIGFYLTIY